MEDKQKDLGILRGAAVQHTPTPWHIIEGDRKFAYNIVADSPNGGTAVVRDVLKEGNAAFIVRAVNAYDQMIVAAHRLLGGMICDRKEFCKPMSADECPVCQLRRAIAKAEGL